jgi:arsenite methyltransferase
MNPQETKELVKEHYAAIARQPRTVNATSCCGEGSSCCSGDDAVFAEDYTSLEGYVADADLGLGCGLPTTRAGIAPGQTVIDLGSGAGNDAFVARSIVGETGKVIGIDMTEIMIEKARANAQRLGLNNVEFRLGDIEKIPVAGLTADVIISNCVLNLVPDKRKAFSEMFRVLKQGGRFSISDVVVSGELPDSILRAAEMYAGCISGAIPKDTYLTLLREVGFDDVTIEKERRIDIPEDLLRKYLPDNEFTTFRSSGVTIASITVTGKKNRCCAPGAGSC